MAYDKPILLVDDEESVLELLSTYLGHKGYRTITTTDPMAVMDLLARHPVEVVVLDYTMPRKDGLVVVREISDYARASARPIQVIMLTAQTDSQVALELARSQILAYINKPPRLQIFLSLVEEGIRTFEERSASR